MKKLLLAVVCLASAMVFTSCFGGSKADKVIDGFEDLVEEVEAKKGKLSADEWREIEADFNERFEKLGIDEINEDDFSTMEKLKLAALTMRWGAAMAESSPTLLEDLMDEAMEDTNDE